MNLIDILLKETETLKDQYVEKTIEWANNGFDQIVERVKRYQTKRISEYTNKNNYYTEQKWVHREGYSISRMDKQMFINKQVEKAKIHYTDSINKLANRIEKKGLDTTKIKTITSHVGVNIDTTLTDGTKTVRAFTIIASGYIQRPHYRYLIK